MATYIYARRAPACALVVRRRRCGSVEAGNRGVRARDLARDFHVTSARSRVCAWVSAVYGRSLSPNFSFFSLVPPDLPIRSAHTPASDASAILRAAFATAVFDATSRALLPPSVCRLLPSGSGGCQSARSLRHATHLFGNLQPAGFLP